MEAWRKGVWKTVGVDIQYKEEVGLKYHHHMKGHLSMSTRYKYIKHKVRSCDWN